MQAATIRVRTATRQTLAQLAAHTHSSVQNVLDAAVESYRRQVFLEQTNQALAGLRNEDRAWKEYRQEIEQWETTGNDGL
jgi:predicted transcriptional regulator